MLFLVKLQASACNFTKINTPTWVFSRFLNCTNATKSHNASQMLVKKTVSKKIQIAIFKKIKFDKTMKSVCQHNAAPSLHHHDPKPVYLENVFLQASPRKKRVCCL